MAAVLALDAACKVTAPTNARIMRNLVLAANMMDSHILHFYHLSVAGLYRRPRMAPWQPSWNVDKRFNTAQTTTLVNNYVTALDMRRLAHEAGAIFGGRMPHPPTYIAGGFTTKPTSAGITKFKELLKIIPSSEYLYSRCPGAGCRPIRTTNRSAGVTATSAGLWLLRSECLGKHKLLEAAAWWRMVPPACKP